MRVGQKIRFGEIQNHYGVLELRLTETGYEWALGDVDGLFWVSIPDYLGEALARYSAERDD